MMSISSCCSNAGRSKYSSLLPRVRRAITRPCVRQLKSRPAIFPLLMLRFSHTASSAPADCIQIQTSFMEYGLQPQGFPVPKPASKHQGQPDQLPKNEGHGSVKLAMSPASKSSLRSPADCFHILYLGGHFLRRLRLFFRGSPYVSLVW